MGRTPRLGLSCLVERVSGRKNGQANLYLKSTGIVLQIYLWQLQPQRHEKIESAVRKYQKNEDEHHRAHSQVEKEVQEQMVKKSKK